MKATSVFSWTSAWRFGTLKGADTLGPELLLATIYFAASLIAIGTTLEGHAIAMMWPANGIVASILIRRRQVNWPVAGGALFVAGIFANHLGTHAAPVVSLGLGLINLAELGAMVYLFRSVIRFPYPNITIMHATVMTLVMGLVVTGLAALLGAGLLHMAVDKAFAPTAFGWWISDALGACLFAPPIILYSRNRLERLLQPIHIRNNLLALAGCVTATCLAVRYVPHPFAVIAIAPMAVAFQVGSFGASVLGLCNGLTVVILWKMGILPKGVDPAIHDVTLAGLPIVALLAAVMPPIAVGLGTDVRRQAVRALRASEQRFRESMEHSPLGMIILDLDGRKTFSNAAMQRMLGFSSDELCDISPESRAHPDEIADIKLRWSSLLTHQIDSYTVKRRFRHRDGHWIWTHCAVSLARNEDGEPLHIVAQVESLEDRRLAEAQVAAERELLRTTLSAIGDAVITIDTTGAVTYMNDAAIALTGRPFESVARMDLMRVLDLRDADTCKPSNNLVARSISDHQSARRQEAVALLRPDSGISYVCETVTPVLNEQRELTSLVVVLHDVTENRERTLDLYRQANHDPLTDLLNRASFAQRVHQTFSRAARLGTPAALIAIDLDHFKAVNDAGGHAAGDAVLKQVAKTLGDLTRPSDAVARLGGDEFAVLLNDCDSRRSSEIAQRLLDALSPLHTAWDGAVHTTGASLGLAHWSKEFREASDWSAAADRACYEAKRGGRGRMSRWNAKQATGHVGLRAARMINAPEDRFSA